MLMLTPKYKLLGILGGTFDPVHNGHLAIANYLLQKLPFEQIHLLPCNIPPHRQQPTASAAQRLHMLELAAKSSPNIYINDIELQRSGPSFMVDTLAMLHQQFP